jgi:hypothetical protein
MLRWLVNTTFTRAYLIDPWLHARRLAVVAIAATAGGLGARSGFGSYYLGIHDRATVAFWHGPMVVVGAWGFAGMIYAFIVATSWIKRANVNPGAVAIFKPGAYVWMWALAFFGWAAWTAPLWVLYQLGALLVAAMRMPVTRALLARRRRLDACAIDGPLEGTYEVVR